MRILITGGASGLGESITRKIAEMKNYTVYFTYSKSEINANKITADFFNANSIKCNFIEHNDVDSLCHKIQELDIDILINNAYNGTFIQSYFHKTKPTDFLKEFNNNIIPTIAITQAAINCFRKKRNGKIITILSAALLNTPPLGSAIYVANKAYMEKLTKVWATENSKYNITSNAISPSLMITGMTDSMDERIIGQITEKHPLKKLLTTTEVADVVCFMLKSSPHMNGVNIVVNSAENIS